MKDEIKMDICIVDDDFEFCQKLKKDLIIYLSEKTDYLNFEIQSSHFNEMNFQKKYHLIFIDIDLLQDNGIDIAQKMLQNNPTSYLVFISSHSSLVFDTLITQPFFFIRKSIYKKDFQSFINLLMEKLKNHQLLHLNYKYTQAVVPISSIIYIEIEVHKLSIHTYNGIYYDNRSLKAIQKILNHEFVQVHKSFLVHLSEVKAIKSQEVIMKNEKVLSIGRSYKEQFKERYKTFLRL